MASGPTMPMVRVKQVASLVVVGGLVLLASVAGCQAEGGPEGVLPGQTGAPAGGSWTLTADDFARPWILLQVPCAARESVQGLTRGANGFLAVVYEDRSEGKVVWPGAYRLASSTDGASWSSSVLEPNTMDRWYQVAQARGRIVIAGMRESQYGLLRSSVDGKSWDVRQTTTNGLKEVAFVNGRFFALGILGGLLVSEDGVTWHDRSQKTAQNNAVAYGNGRWVVAGNTSFFVSTDAVTWIASGLACSDAASCPGATQPGWQPGQPVVIGVSSIFFARGKFYAGEYVSTDGQSWNVNSDPAQVPSTYQGDTFLRFVPGGAVQGSHDGVTWSMQTTLGADNPAGYTCAAHRCFTATIPDIGRVIVLVP